MRMLPLMASAVASACVLLVLSLATATADSLPELWKRPVRATYDSAKSALALENCIGSAVSDWGYPHVVHGEGITDIFVGAPYAIRIEDKGQTRKISFTATAGYNDRVGRAIGGCL